MIRGLLRGIARGISRGVSGIIGKVVGGKKSPTVSRPAPAPAPAPTTTSAQARDWLDDEDEIEAKIVLDSLVSIMEEGEHFEHRWQTDRGYGRKGDYDAAGTALTQRNARDLALALSDGRAKYSNRQILESVRNAFGSEDFVALKIEQLIYAAFNSPKSDPSGYAKWAGGGTYKADMDKAKRALRGEYL